MKKLFLLASVITLVAVMPASAQLTSGDFGIAASFSQDYQLASILYSISPKLDIALGFGITSVSIDYPEPTPDPDSQTTMAIAAGLRYFLKEGDVSPYLGAMVSYMKPPDEENATGKTETTNIGIQVVLGGQAWLTKKVAVFSHFGVSYDMQSQTYTPITGSSSDSGTNTLSLFTAAVGAAFYL